MTSIRRSWPVVVALAITAGCGGATDHQSGASDGAVVAISYVGETPPRLVVHDSATGDVLWSTVGRVDTPMFDFGDTMVWVIPGRERLIGIDMSSGERSWHRDVGDGIISMAQAGDDMLVVTKRELVAVDARTGEQRWRFSSDGIDGVEVGDDGHRVLVVSDDEHALLDTRDGTPVWQRQVGRTRLAPLAAIALADGLLAWSGPRLSVATVGSDVTVVSISEDDTVVALDADDGSERWSFDVVSAWVTQLDGNVVIVADEGALAVAARGGDVLWSHDFGDALPDGVVEAVVHDRLLLVVGSDGGMLAMDTVDGAVLWERTGVHRYVTSAGAVIAAVVDGTPTTIDPDTGAVIWTGAPDTSPVPVPMLVLRGADGLTVVGAPPGDDMTAMDLRTGEVRWVASAEQWWEGS